MQRLTDLPEYDLSKVMVPKLPPHVGLTWLENGNVEITGAPADLSEQIRTQIEDAIYEAAGLKPPLWARIRARRNELLAGSDWTQLPDVKTDSAAWRDYRQALRDIPQKFSEPELVVWPDVPAAGKGRSGK